VTDPTQRIDEIEKRANAFSVGGTSQVSIDELLWLLPYARLGAMVVEDRVV